MGAISNSYDLQNSRLLKQSCSCHGPAFLGLAKTSQIAEWTWTQLSKAMLTLLCHTSLCPQRGKGKDRAPPAPPWLWLSWAHSQHWAPAPNALELGSSQCSDPFQSSRSLPDTELGTAVLTGTSVYSRSTEPHQPPKASCSLLFLLKRVWWIYSFFKHHRTIYSALRTSHKNVCNNPAEYFP